MATLGVLRLTPSDFVIYRDLVEFMGVILNYVTADWKEYQEHVKTDPDAQAYHSDVDRMYVARVMPL